MKKQRFIFVLGTLITLQLLLTACPKKPKPATIVYQCDRYEMMDDSNGQLYNIVSDTSISIYFNGQQMTVFGETITLDENDSYKGYHPICDNSTFYARQYNDYKNIEVAYEIPMGDSTLHVTYIGVAN